ncbi:MAG TPA: Asp-tRNA(Asn)/Glu-tRNA(Gln) amidotransferase GatCAB subunit C [Rhodospirillaceae bacterium]|nr:Asp-tRNA(Asn)/Glu-tRNA(Gln) amidotransferase GatCAB subunit C [Rhodospirillaceae bacterium]
MSIDAQTARKIARLAHIKIPPDELTAVAEDLSKIVEWVGQLDEVKADGVEPLANVNDKSLGWREQDVVTDGGKAKAILANAPSRTADYFTVPKVVE